MDRSRYQRACEVVGGFIVDSKPAFNCVAIEWFCRKHWARELRFRKSARLWHVSWGTTHTGGLTLTEALAEAVLAVEGETDAK